MSKLPGARKDATAIDPDREIEGVAVFQGHDFRRDFRGAVERNRRGRGKIFGDSILAHALGQRNGEIRGERALLDDDRNLGERLHGVDPARAQESESSLMLLCQLEEIYRSVEVV